MKILVSLDGSTFSEAILEPAIQVAEAADAEVHLLTVIEEEGLRERAQRVGSWLARELRALAADTPSMGDVRGAGMYLGIEWVVPGDEPRPDPQAAESVVSQLKERGFLLSTDGPQHNVIKIKPPLAFDMDEAQLLCSALRRIVLSRDSTA